MARGEAGRRDEEDVAKGKTGRKGEEEEDKWQRGRAQVGSDEEEGKKGREYGG